MKILFVCTGNTCRSPMAEAFAKKEAEKRKLDITAESAGIMTADGLPASENAVAALKKEDIDISTFKSSCLTKEKAENADLILTMTEEQCLFLRSAFPDKKVFCLKNSDISDPYGKSLSEYEKCAEEIKTAVKAVFDKLENDRKSN